MDRNNTVEYRANLEVSGIKTGAAEAAKAIAGIDGVPAAKSIQGVGAEAARMGSAVQVAASAASEGLLKVAKASATTGDHQAQASQAGQQFLSALREQIAVSGKSTDELLRYRAAQSGVAAEAAPLILQLHNQRAAQEAAAAAARLEEAALRESAAAKQRATAAQDAFMAGLREQIALQGKSTTEVLQYRAAQLGVSGEASQYINQISEANKKGALTAGQHAQAMRMLPMQITDVVTSIASGMPIWMVAIQQGGQVRDSFGGAGAAARAMLGAITPLTAGIALATVGAGLLVAAYYQGQAEAAGFTRALVMTGNTAGVTASQMSDMAKAAAESVGTQGEAAKALTAMAGTGAVAGENLKQFSVIASNLERYAGQPIKTTAEHMAKLGDAPVKASVQLNEQYHYLTETVYQQIKALEDKGRKEEAAALAQKTYANAMAERAAEMKGSLGSLETAWNSLGLMARKTWDAMLNVGRAATLEDIRSKIAKTNDELNGLLTGNGFASTAGGAALGGGAKAHARRLEQLRQQLGELQSQAAPFEAAETQAQLRAEQQANEDAKIAARQRTDALRKETRSRKEIRDEEIAQLNRDRVTLAMGQDEFDKLLAGINERHKDPKKSSPGGISISDNQLAGLRSQLEAAQLYQAQLQTLGAGASELNAGERESLKLAEQIKLATNAKTRSKLEEAKAMADALGVQLRSNDGMEKSYKAHQQSIEGNYKDADAIAQRAKEQKAANEVFGKGRTAIEQMKLATLEQQLAEAEGSDNFDPKYIASLRAKIAAQKDWTAALSQADYKAVQAQADELLRNAQEMGKSYQQEFALSGVSAQQRQIIAEQRQVELKYAQKIAEVDKLNLGDAEKKAALGTLEQARMQELANAASKVNLQVWSESVREYDDVFRKGFADMLNRGEGKWKSFTTSLKTTFKTTVADQLYKAFAQPLVIPVIAAVQGVLGSITGTNAGAGLSGAASGSGSALNVLSTIKNAYSAISGGFTSSLASGISSAGKMMGSQAAQSFAAGMKGATLAPGLAGPTTSGASGAMGAGSSFSGVASFAPYAAMIAAGMKLSANAYDQGYRLTDKNYAASWAVTGGIAPPTLNLDTKLLQKLGISGRTANMITGAALWAKGFSKVFGGKVTQKDGGIEGLLGGDVQSYARFKKDGGWFGSDSYWTQRAGWSGNSGVQSTYAELRSGVVEQAKALQLSADAVSKYTQYIKISTKGLSDEQLAEQLQAQMTAAGNTMAGMAMGTTAYIRAGESALETLSRLSTSITVANASLELMGSKLYTVGLSGADMASKLIDQFGGAEAYLTASDAYFRTYYTHSEQANGAMRALEKQFAALGIAVPRSREQFRYLASSLDLNTSAGREMYAALLGLAPAVDETMSMLEELANTAASELISTYTRAAAVAPGMRLARDVLNQAADAADDLAGPLSSINKLLGDASSGVLTFGSGVRSTTSALNPAQLAVNGLRSEILDLQAAASGTVDDFVGLSAALQNVDTRTFVATMGSAMDLIAQRLRDELSSIADERVAVREAAMNIIGAQLMTPAQIRAQIAAQTVTLPGQSGIASAQSALAKADALVAKREQEAIAARAKSNSTGGGALANASALENARGNAARDLVAVYLKHENVRQGIKGESVPGSLAALAVYEDTQANMLAKMQNLPTAEIQAFADQLASLGTYGLRGGLGSTNSYLRELSEYQAARANEAANNAKAATLRNQAAQLSDKAVAAEQALAAARTAQSTAAGSAQKAQLDYVAALQKYSLDSSKAVSSLGKLREETVAWYESQQALAQTMGNSASGLRSTVADIRFGQLDTASQYANLQERFNVAYSMAMSTQGETLAGYGDELNALINPLLQKAQDAGLTGTAYANLVATALARAEAVAGRLEKDAPATYQEESLGLLGQIDSTLAALEAGAKTSDQILTEAIKAGSDTTRDGLRAVIAALQGKPVPAFALGGMHSGGLRLVGERGPELEVTGPARYFNADITQRMLSGPATLPGFDIEPLLHEIRELRQVVEYLRTERQADALAIATNTGRTQRLLDRMGVEGMPVRNVDGERLATAGGDA